MRRRHVARGFGYPAGRGSASAVSSLSGCGAGRRHRDCFFAQHQPRAACRGSRVSWWRMRSSSTVVFSGTSATNAAPARATASASLVSAACDAIQRPLQQRVGQRHHQRMRAVDEAACLGRRAGGSRCAGCRPGRRRPGAPAPAAGRWSMEQLEVLLGRAAAGAPSLAAARRTKRSTSASPPSTAADLRHSGSTSSGFKRRWAKMERFLRGLLAGALPGGFDVPWLARRSRARSARCCRRDRACAAARH